MSNSKKNWNAGKAMKRSADANKKTIKMKASERKEAEKRVSKGKA